MHVPVLNGRRGNLRPVGLSNDLLRFSNDEIDFFWNFVQGSIMNPETRWSLRHNWGMCDRHSFGFIAAEAAYRHGFLMGQAVLYHDLMERAAAALQATVPHAVAFRLREKKSCLMCKMGYSLTNGVGVHSERIAEGRNLDPIRAFACETVSCWRDLVCGVCAGNENLSRCRIHLRTDLIRVRPDTSKQREIVKFLFHHISRYMQSFIWDYRSTLRLRIALL